jgi:thioredoxin 1|mmetsp:Transcript_57411/g.171247  ORF Transcript_57411/g.171247 Transcript_57411/m.171247 type:complete len:190 (-) Transcript_57411:219-788(-)|eukprot:CAMPEP_0113551448 /NCGR_PEP_ID=MMETSP0015_2-20120614/14531_1 /TAXON_ID=2838 /ORGANISM="Odontella" /LENGTH=189 /DNA_ID=CAMNT_0000452343 /DNA_START=178 /DNA_END=747 /DNA_ORIENTATION=- /assembly_acc=CAM_ASM_000160
MVRIHAFLWVTSSTAAFSTRSVPALTSSVHKRTGRRPLQAQIVDLDDSNYRDTLLGGGEKSFLVDACAVWCGPCKLIEPIVRRCGEKWSDRLDVMRYDIESKSTNVKMELLRQDALPQKLPSLILFRDGKAVAKHSGIISEEELDDFISSNLADQEDLDKDIIGAAEEQRSGFISFGASHDDYMLSGLP